MVINETGGSAFPVSAPLSKVNEGMTLRDFLAAFAMSSLIVRCDDTGDTLENVSGYAYDVADAMLKVRQPEQQP